VRSYGSLRKCAPLEPVPQNLCGQIPCRYMWLDGYNLGRSTSVGTRSVSARFELLEIGHGLPTTVPRPNSLSTVNPRVKRRNQVTSGVRA